MAKMFIFLVCISLVLFESTQSISFQCDYVTGYWGTLGTPYVCEVENSVNITSLDAATVETITGEHRAEFNNNNVEAFYVYYKGQIHFFPSGLNKFFKNLKGIQIAGTGLKEVHKSDLRNFPQLEHLYLHDNQLEVLEKNLFVFNPNLEMIYLVSNKISYIHPNVFDKLTNLKSLLFAANTCINMYAINDPTEVQIIIKTTKAQCANLKDLMTPKRPENMTDEALKHN